MTNEEFQKLILEKLLKLDSDMSGMKNDISSVKVIRQV